MVKYYDINEQGHSVRCKLYFDDLKKAKKAIVYGIGFAGHKDNNAAAVFCEKLLSKHKDVLVIIFEWPAHGEDATKKLTLEGCDLYLSLVINELKTKFGIDELYAYATSFGGYLFLKYLYEHGSPFVKMALRCPATRFYDVLVNRIMREDEYDRIMKGKDVLVGFDRKIAVTRAFLDSIRENDLFALDFMDYADDVLILHGTKDEVVPIEYSEEFCANNLMEFIPIEGADHRFKSPVHMSLANKYVMEFLGL